MKSSHHNIINISSLITCSVLLLTACGEKSNSSAVSEEDILQASQNEQKTLLQTFQDSTKKLSIQLPNSFMEQDTNNVDSIDLADKEKITLFMHDPQNNISVYSTYLGTLNTDPSTYFNNLKQVINQQKGYENIQNGAATENRMNYQYTIKNSDDDILNESCLAMINNKTDLYTVCAFSPSQNFNILNDQLHNINFSIDEQK